MKKIAEAYVGEYASGKSENAINRALQLASKKRKVVLADLDLVEPFYTLRPLKKMLEKENIEVLTWETKDLLGLGETGAILRPDLRWVLKKEGDLILDIGYGVEGIKTLNLLEGYKKDSFLKVFIVINTLRPMTSTIADIVDYISGLEKVDGLINNTHLGDDTDVEIIQKGAEVVTDVAKRLNLSVIHTTAEKSFQSKLGSKDICGNPVFYIERYMQNSFW